MMIAVSMIHHSLEPVKMTAAIANNKNDNALIKRDHLQIQTQHNTQRHNTIEIFYT